MYNKDTTNSREAPRQTSWTGEARSVTKLLSHSGDLGLTAAAATLSLGDVNYLGGPGSRAAALMPRT
ncbi:hypothetical protein ElyMa_006255500 [Elysia marginata]|uniref:Uncharacterized protein n=1 Tax=Elysia marginata TaxID=1093978 RepID=A0AAV4HC91_9GAST|nr:hypothetical protein ElyMa_006255500 [Elysia marginata]